jgi:hypothetical protein
MRKSEIDRICRQVEIGLWITETCACLACLGGILAIMVFSSVVLGI